MLQTSSAALVMGGAPLSAAGLVLPSGGQVVAGSANISASATGVTVDQTTATAVIDWQGFSVGAGGFAQFNNGQGATLNRVTGGEMSTIAGQLSATGSLYLINPAGVVIDGSGKVLTGGSFIASTRAVDMASFMAGGELSFVGDSAGGIVNRGEIRSGRDAVLIGHIAENRGSVFAGGVAALATGGRVVLRPANGDARIMVEGASGDVTNSGTIMAAAAELRAAGGNVFALAGNNGGLVRATADSLRGGGKVTLAAKGRAVVEGAVEARAANGDGGTVHILGESISLRSTARVDASGRRGGTVLVGGDYLGGQSEEIRLSAAPLPTAKRLGVSAGAIVRADGRDGTGGNIVLWSDETTRFHGTISARGGAMRGDGGFVEVSSKELLDFRGSVDLLAPAGKAGRLLLDPNSITIQAASPDIDGALSGATNDITAATDLDSATLDFAGAASVITAGALATLLDAGNVTLAATNRINVNADVTSTSASDRTLTLTTTATGNGTVNVGAVNLAANITGSGAGRLNLILNTDQVYATAGTYTTNGGNVTIRPTTTNRGVNVGAADSVTILGLTDAELDRFVTGSTGTLAVVANGTGTATLSAAQTRAEVGTFELRGGGPVSITSSFAATSGGAQTFLVTSSGATTLNTVTASGTGTVLDYTVNSTGNIAQSAGTVTATAPATINLDWTTTGTGNIVTNTTPSYTTGGGTFRMRTSGTGTIDTGTGAISTGGGTVTIQSGGASLRLDAAVNSGGGAILVQNTNATAGTITGATGASLTSGAGSIDVQTAAGTITLGGALSSTGANVTVASGGNGNVAMTGTVGTANGDLAISSSGTGTLSSTGATTVGTGTATYTTINGNLTTGAVTSTRTTGTALSFNAQGTNHTLTTGALGSGGAAISGAATGNTSVGVITSGGGDVSFTSGGTFGLAAGSTTTGAGAFTVSSAGTATLSGSLTTNSAAVSVTSSAGAVSVVGAVVTNNGGGAGAGVTLSGQTTLGTNAITTGGGAVSLTAATGAITQTASTTISTAGGSGGITATAGGAVTLRTLTTGGGAVDVSTSGGLVSAGAITSGGGNVSLVSTFTGVGTVAAGAINSGAGAITMTGGTGAGSNVTSTGMTTTGAVAMTASNGSIAIGTAAHSIGAGNFSASAANGITVSNSLTSSGGNIDLMSSGAANVTLSGAVTSNGTGYISVQSGQDISISSALASNGNGNVTIAAARDVLQSATVTTAGGSPGTLAVSGRDIVIGAALTPGGTTAATLTATREIRNSGSGTITMGGTAGITMSAAGINLTRGITRSVAGAGLSLTATGASGDTVKNVATAGLTTTNAAISVDSNAAISTAAITSGGGAIALTALDGSVTTGNLSASGGAGTVTVSGSGTVSSGSVTTANAAASLQTSAGAITTGNVATGGGALTVVTTGTGASANATTGTISTGGGAVTVTAGTGTTSNLQTGVITSAGGNVALTASQGTLTLTTGATTTGAGSFTATSLGNMTLTGSVATTGGAVTVATTGASGDLTVAGGITTGAGGDVSIVSGRDLTQTGAVTAGGTAVLTMEAARDLTLGANNTVNSTAATTFSAGRDLLTNTGGTITMAGTSARNLVAAGMVNLQRAISASSAGTALRVDANGGSLTSVALTTTNAALTVAGSAAVTTGALTSAGGAIAVTAGTGVGSNLSVTSTSSGGGNATLTASNGTLTTTASSTTTTGAFTATSSGAMTLAAVSTSGGAVALSTTGSGGIQLNGAVAVTGAGTIDVASAADIVVNANMTTQGGFASFVANNGNFSIGTAVGNRVIETQNGGSVNGGALTIRALGSASDVLLGRTGSTNQLQIYSENGALTIEAGRDVRIFADQSGGWTRVGQTSDATTLSITAGRELALQAGANANAFVELNNGSGGSTSLTAATLTIQRTTDSNATLQATAGGPLTIDVTTAAIQGTTTFTGDTSLTGAYTFTAGNGYSATTNTLVANADFTLASGSSMSFVGVPFTLTTSGAAGNLTFSGALTADADAPISLTALGGDSAIGSVTSQSAFTLNGTGTVASTADVAFNGPVSATTVLARGGTFALGDSVTASGADGNGDAIVISALSTFTNTAGSAAFSNPNGRFLVYSANPDDNVGDTPGTTAFNLYNRTFAANAPATLTGFAGNRMVYAFQPTITLTGETLSKEYGETASPGFSVSGLRAGDLLADALTATPTVSSLGTAPGANVGSYATNVAATASSQGYAVSLVAGALTVTRAPLTITADARSKIYGANDPALTYGVAGLKNGQVASLVLSGTLGRTAGNDVGTYAINLGSLAASANYTIQTFNTADLGITPATLTVSAIGQSKIYGAADPALTFNASGFQYSDTVASVLTGALTRAAGETVAGGPYAIGQGSLAANANYTVAFTGANLAITPATLNVTADAKSKTYGATDPTLTYSASGFQFSDTIASVLTGGLARTAGESVGGSPYTITLGTLAANSNYNIAYTGAQFAVTPAPLTVTADNATKVYGVGTLTFTYTTTGLQFGEAQGSVLSGALARAPGEDVGTYSINVGSLVANANYTIQTFVPGTLTITPALLNVTADARTKVYGDADPALTFAATGFQFSDTAGSVLTGTLGRAAGESVAGGPYAITQGSLAANANYTVNFTGSQLSVTPATLSVTADARSKTYGGTDPALTFTATGLRFSDTVASVLSGGLARAAGESVGSSPYGIGLGTLSANSNYTIAYTGAQFSITPAPLTVTAHDATKVYGVGTLAFTRTATGLQFGDAQSDVLNGELSRDPGENVGTYTINIGSLTSNANYTIQTFVPGTLTITPAVLNVAADARTKIYGDADPALTFAATGFQFSDTAGSVLTGTLTRAAGESVAGGPYAITQGSLAANANYTVAFTGNALSVSPATLTIAPNAAVKVYGDTDPALTFSASGFKLGDGMPALMGLLARTAGETVAGGPYAINLGTLSAGSNYVLALSGNAALSITPATLSVTALPATKTYGDADPAFAFAATGFRLADSIANTMSGTLARAAGETVAGGPYAITLGTLSAGSNYAISLSGGALRIDPATLTVTPQSSSKIFGQPDPVFAFTATGFRRDDNAASLTGALARVAGETVAGGPYAITRGSLSAGSNYVISLAGSAAMSILPAEVFVTYRIADSTSVFGTQPVVGAVTLNGVQAGDDVVGLTGVFNTTGDLVTLSPTLGAGSYAVRVTGFGGAAASNYRLAASGNVDGALTVSQAPLTVAIADAVRAVGTPNPAFAATVSGLVASDTVASLFGSGGVPLTTDAGFAAPAGRYAITTTVRLRNYALTVQPGVLTVTGLALPPPDIVTPPDVVGGSLTSLAATVIGDAGSTAIADFVTPTGDPATSPLSNDPVDLASNGLRLDTTPGPQFVIAYEAGTARAVAVEARDGLLEDSLLRASTFERDPEAEAAAIEQERSRLAALR